MLRQSRALLLVCIVLLVLFVVHMYESYNESIYMSIVGKQVKKNEVQVKPVAQKRPKIIPVVADKLTVTPFNRNWTEDHALTALRKFGVVENIPGADVLKTYDLKKLSAIYHSFLDNEHVQCHRKLRMGKAGDGGWEICDDIEWRPVPPCIIYSFGINYDFSFDDDAGRMYGCDIYSFDPSMAKMNTTRRSGRVMFFKVGIGGKSGVAEKKKNWILHSFANIRVMLNHSNTVIDVLKMDVELSEWPALQTMIKEGQLSDVRQLLVEYHSGKDSKAQLRDRLQVLGDLEKEGFKIFYSSKNYHCARRAVAMPITRTGCYEIHYLNTNFRRESPST